MIPLVVMLVAWGAFRLLAVTGRLPAARTAAGSLRLALAVMFAFTGVSHFLPTVRPDMVRMVPPGLPWPEHLVTLTGVLELAGAVGLLIPRLAPLAAWALAALLVAVFPANVYAARAGLVVGGAAATPLVWRLPLQLLWIGALLWVARAHRRTRTRLD